MNSCLTRTVYSRNFISFVRRPFSVSCPSSTQRSNSVFPLFSLDPLPVSPAVCLSSCLSVGQTLQCRGWESLTDFLNQANSSESHCEGTTTNSAWMEAINRPVTTIAAHLAALPAEVDVINRDERLIKSLRDGITVEFKVCSDSVIF